MDKTTLKAVQIAVYVGALLARDVVTKDEAEDEIRDKMQKEGIADEDFADIQTLAYEFKVFGDHVRAAERKKLPVIKVYGETLPET